MTWDWDQLQDLSECLVECLRMRHRKGRDKVVDQLGRYIGVGAVTIERADTDLADVLAIVRRCNEYTGGIESLIRVVHRFEGDSTPMKAVWQCLSSLLMPNAALESDRLAAFLRFSSKARLTGEKAVSAYHRVVPQEIRNHFGLSSPNESGLWVVTAELCDVRPAGDQPPYLLLFLHALAEFIRSDQDRKKYVGWLSKVQKRLGYTGKVEKKPIEDKRESPETYILLNIIQPKTIPGAPNFEATIHVAQGERVSKSLVQFDGNEKTVAEKLERWIAGFFANRHPKPAGIEVFLPPRLLFKVAPHRWPTCQGVDLIPSRLGCDYPTVVRLDRKAVQEKHPPSRDAWKKKWVRFQKVATDGGSLGGGVNHWINEAETEDLRKLLNRCRVKDAPPVMLAAFQPKSPESRPGLAHIILQSGMPVALWGDVGRGDMEKILEKVSWKTLPADMKEVRLEAGERDPGSRVTLLWDDPVRELPAILHEPEKTQFTDGRI